MSPKKKSYRVLVVDDSEDDRFFLRQAIKRFPRFAIIAEATDGEEAIHYLGGQAGFGDREKHPLPDLILLDLKMPRKTGFEVLEWLRSQPFPQMCVIVLSDSALQMDVGSSLALGAHGYWTKTASIERQNLIAEEIEAMLDQRFSRAA